MASVFKQPGKGLLGLVSHAVSNQTCAVQVEFLKPGSEEAVGAIRLKAQGKNAEHTLPLYEDAAGQPVCGNVKVTALQGGKLDHQGVRVQLIGVIELLHSGVKNHEFLSLSRELSAAGEVRGDATFAFSFANVDMSMDSYRGSTLRLSYMLRVTISRGIGGLSEDFPLWVRNSCKEEIAQEPIKLEVGIENCLHLEFTYSSSVYGVSDCVLGSVHFKLVKINLKTMELEVRRKEITTAASKAAPDLQTLYKYEIMDGAPVRGELLPVRLYLDPLELSPTYENVQNKFSVKYLLNLVLVDSEERRYFKQHEITLVRRPPAATPPAGASSAAEAES